MAEIDWGFNDLNITKTVASVGGAREQNYYYKFSPGISGTDYKHFSVMTLGVTGISGVDVTAISGGTIQFSHVFASPGFSLVGAFGCASNSSPMNISTAYMGVINDSYAPDVRMMEIRKGALESGGSVLAAFAVTGVSGSWYDYRFDFYTQGSGTEVVLDFYENAGTFGSPAWTKRVTYTDSTNIYQPGKVGAFTTAIYQNYCQIIAGSGVAGEVDGYGVSAQMNAPHGLCKGESDNVLYITDFTADNVRKITLDDRYVSTVAGSTSGGYVDAIGTAAAFDGPSDIAYLDGYIYLTDQLNNRIRKIDISTNEVTTFAGDGTKATTDGTGTGAQFDYPYAICTDGTDLFVSELSGHVIRKITVPGAVVTTVCGSGSAVDTDGTGLSAAFNFIYDICWDGDNSCFYVTTSAASASNRLRKVTYPGYVVTTLAGTGTAVTTNGFTTTAAFNRPQGCFYYKGKVFVSEAVGNVLRCHGLESTYTNTIAGDSASTNTEGPGTTASLGSIKKIEVINDNLYLTSPGTHVLWKISAVEQAEFVAGSVNTGGDDGIGEAVSMNRPINSTALRGYVYFVGYNGHTIRRLDPTTGEVVTIVGSYGNSGTTDGYGTAARLNNPLGICPDTNGNHFLYITENTSYKLRKIDIDDSYNVTTLYTHTAGLRNVHCDSNYLWVVSSDNKVYRCGHDGSSWTTIAGSGVASHVNGNGTSATFNGMNGLVGDSTNLYIADSTNNVIRKMTKASPYTVTDFAGIAATATTSGNTDGTGTAARFNNPQFMYYDELNSVIYVCDYSNYKIRKITVPDAVVTSYTGSASTTEAVGAGVGHLKEVSFAYPRAISKLGNYLFIGTDQTNRYRIMKILMDYSWDNNKIDYVKIDAG